MSLFFKALLVILINGVCFSRENKFEILKDLFNKQELLQIHSYLCWHRENNLRLAKSLYTINRSLVIQVITKSLHSFNRKQNAAILVDLNCENACNLLIQGQNLRMLKQPHNWIVFGSRFQLQSCGIGLNPDTNFYLLEEFPSGCGIFEIYAFAESSQQYIARHIGYWSKEWKSLNFTNLNTLANRRDFAATPIDVVYSFVNEDAKRHIWDYRNKYIDASIFTFGYILTYYTTKWFNFTVNFTFHPPGYVKELVSGKFDMSASPIYITEERITSIDFIAPLNPTSLKFILKAPPLSYVSNLFILPFDDYVWYSVLILTVLTIGLAYLVVRWEWKDSTFKAQVESVYDSMRPDFLEAVMMQLSIASQQGSNFEMKSISGRIVMTFTLIAFMFLYNSYSANIVALLQSTTSYINSLDGLLNSRIEVGMENLNFSVEYFTDGKDLLKKALYDQKIAPAGRQPNMLSVEEGMKKTRNEFFAYHSLTENIYEEVSRTFDETEKCNLIEISYATYMQPFLTAKKGWSYTEFFKIGLGRLRELGVYQRENHLLQPDKPFCTTRQSNFVSAGLLDTYFPFTFLLFSIIACAVLLVIEVLLIKFIGQRGVCTEKSESFEDFRLYGDDTSTNDDYSP